MSNRPPEITTNRREAWASGKIMRVIQSFCYECMGGTRGQTADCTAPECPLWPWRVPGTGNLDGFREAERLLKEESRNKGLPDLSVRRDLSVRDCAFGRKNGNNGNEGDEE